MELNELLKEQDVAGAMSINPADINNELLRMAALYSRYGFLAARARKQRDASKSNLELVEAKLDRKIREKLTADGEKITEGVVKARLITQTPYQEAQTALNDANEILSVADATLNALAMKRDMLVQLNKNAEREWSATSTGVTTESLKEAVREGFKALKKSP